MGKSKIKCQHQHLYYFVLKTFDILLFIMKKYKHKMFVKYNKNILEGQYDEDWHDLFSSRNEGKIGSERKFSFPMPFLIILVSWGKWNTQTWLSLSSFISRTMSFYHRKMSWYRLNLNIIAIVWFYNIKTQTILFRVKWKFCYATETIWHVATNSQPPTLFRHTHEFMVFSTIVSKIININGKISSNIHMDSCVCLYVDLI